MKLYIISLFAFANIRRATCPKGAHNVEGRPLSSAQNNIFRRCIRNCLRLATGRHLHIFISSLNSPQFFKIKTEFLHRSTCTKYDHKKMGKSLSGHWMRGPRGRGVKPRQRNGLKVNLQLAVAFNKCHFLCLLSVLCAPQLQKFQKKPIDHPGKRKM